MATFWSPIGETPSKNSRSGLNEKRFFGSLDWKIPRKSGTAQKVVPVTFVTRFLLCSVLLFINDFVHFVSFAIHAVITVINPSCAI